MNTATIELEHRPDKAITPRADRIDVRHAPGGRAPTFTMTWDRSACEAGAWRTVADGRALRVAPARGLDADAILRDVIEDLLADNADGPDPQSEIRNPKSNGGGP